jgi:hypothetical protein
LAFATSWAPTGVYTDSQGPAFVEAAGILYGFHRGADGKLKLMANNYDYQTGVRISSSTSAVDGSPLITADAASAAYDSSTGKVFVAVRTQAGRVQVAEGKAGTGGISSWAWNDLGSTNASPAVVVACNRVHVAVSAGGGVPVRGGGGVAVSAGNIAPIVGGSAIWTIQ